MAVTILFVHSGQVKYVKARTERRNWTKLNWRGLVVDELTNGQAVMHYSRHRLTASVAYETTLT